jgi:FkbM family methyltransferase
MTATRILTMDDAIKVVVIDSLEQITTYVLEEQLDWFEDELNALRKILKPGQTVLDIGANLGMYALSMARVVGQEGRVIAFEPASSTAALLQQSADLNGFSQIEVDTRGVGVRSGTARLTLDLNPELNRIEDMTSDPEATDGIETIILTSLDDWAAEHGPYTEISLIKIDAEGQELNVIAGAHKLLHTHSPLILYEIKHGDTVNTELVDAFADLGYASYSLAPGPMLLMPWNPALLDGFTLNIFCCKADTAKQMEQDGILAQHWSSQTPTQPAEHDKWTSRLVDLPYVMCLHQSWTDRNKERGFEPAERALALHALSTDARHPPSTRIQALAESVELLKELCSTYQGPIHLASLARCAREIGQRELACEALRSLIQAIPYMENVDFEQPFLAPCKRFDALPPNDSMQGWLMAAAIEANEIASNYSSFFAQSNQRDLLQFALSLGFDSPPLQRRLDLINRRFPPSADAS